MLPCCERRECARGRRASIHWPSPPASPAPPSRFPVRAGSDRSDPDVYPIGGFLERERLRGKENARESRFFHYPQEFLLDRILRDQAIPRGGLSKIGLDPRAAVL